MMEMEFAGFKSLNETELTEIDGGIGALGAGLIFAGGCFVIGFIGSFIF